jgi:hypothetical protein
MSEVIFHDWRSYRGRVLPRMVIEQAIAQAKAAPIQISSRLKIGEYVRLRVDDLLQDRIDWLPAIVIDVKASFTGGVEYILAFPQGVGDYYVISQEWAGVKLRVTGQETESKESSGIYTEAEFEEHLNARQKPVDHPAKPALSIVK